MKEILYTRFDEKPRKRGTIDTDNGEFIRDNTPTIKVNGGYFICLEPDVVEQLEERCKFFNWGIKGKGRMKIPFEVFKLSPVVMMGGRKQHRFYVPNTI